MPALVSHGAGLVLWAGDECFPAVDAWDGAVPASCSGMSAEHRAFEKEGKGEILVFEGKNEGIPHVVGSKSPSVLLYFFFVCVD